MYDLSSAFNEFYKCHVVLPKALQGNLHEKKELNVQRLKGGLKEYNDENGTKYSVVETCVQGSVAMSTVVQNERDDYDIDVAIVFDKSALGDKGPLATRNIVANALRRKTWQFNVEPEVKTSCVRIRYAEGYHVDFAVYRRECNSENGGWVYEHAGVDWTMRDLRGLNDWFNLRNDSSDGNLRKVVRLSKMFCKSRDSWKNMPSGLLQTVLCDEKLHGYNRRIDELFYYTMKEIVARLEGDMSVTAPVDHGRSLAPRNSDVKQMMNWKNRLKSKLEDLEILFSEKCTKVDALQAWYGFFNHDYWAEQVEVEDRAPRRGLRAVCRFDETEQYIEDQYPVSAVYTCKVVCRVTGNGWRPMLLPDALSVLRRYLPHNLEIRCNLDATNCPPPYDVLWKVKNVGSEAERRNDIRGQIVKRGRSIVEYSRFFGNHYIECYIIKNGFCVARERVDVPIDRV